MERHSRQQLGAKARARIVDNYSIDKIIREYYELYEEVLAENI
jgi:glycosyltransferase involved in cell wall biosynthesis